MRRSLRADRLRIPVVARSERVWLCYRHMATPVAAPVASPVAYPTTVPPLVAELQAIAGKSHVLWRFDELRSYEYDGSIDVGHPEAVVLVGSREEVVAVVKLARRYG